MRVEETGEWTVRRSVHSRFELKLVASRGNEVFTGQGQQVRGLA